MAKLYGNGAEDFAPSKLMSFGKSFSRTNGQPLDKSEIWYNDLEALKAYAKTDAAYAGQIVAYISMQDENIGTITHYSIEVDGSLKALGNAENIDDIEGILSRIEALEDTAPTTESIQTMVNTAVAAAGTLKREVVATWEELEGWKEKDDFDKYIFLYKPDIDSDHYDEYIIINHDGSKFIDKVGSWEIDLTQYATKEDLKEYAKVADLENYATKDEAELNVINSASSDFNIDDNRELQLSQSFLDGLAASLNTKYDRTDGLLINENDRAKLNALDFDEGELVISSTVQADNVKGLGAWIAKNKNTYQGLSEENFTTALKTKLESLKKIVSLSDDFNLSTEGQLSLNPSIAESISSLDAELKLKASQAGLDAVSQKATTLETEIANYSARLATIENLITWQDLND